MEASADMVVQYGVWSLVPSLLAISAALLTRQVFVSLFLGVWSGAWILAGPGLEGAFNGFFRVLDTYVLQAIVPENGDGERMSILLFSLITGGMIGVITRNGGMEGIVAWLMRYADTRKKALSVTTGLGGVIFFDDYANTLIVGNTMRPLIDRLRISREKLAFIVDSTAAPVASVAVITTWFAFEMTLVKDALPEGYQHLSAFELMVGGIAYSYYPVLMLVFIICCIVMGRDFGPMLKAERAALKGENLKVGAGDSEESGAKPLAINGVAPILTLIGTTFAGLMVTGEGDGLRDILGSADPFKSLMWGSLMGLVVALLLSVVTRAMSLQKAVDAMEGGLSPMLLAAMILTFAWAIADINDSLHTAEYIISWLGDSLAPEWLPVMVFVIAAATSFATGTSWGTMGILIPLVVPLAVIVLQSPEPEVLAWSPIMLASIASVLSGSVWGDHCSPISDTTVLSSLASGCHHMQHVITQIPYAVSVALISMIVCILPASYGVPWWLAMLIGIVAIGCVVRYVGKPVMQEE